MTLPEFSHKIQFPWGQDRKVMRTKRRPAVYASKGEVFMRCGGCGSTDFTVFLKPGKMGAAKLTNLSCSLCGKLFPFNDNGETGGTLTMEKADARKREEINARPDS